MKIVYSDRRGAQSDKICNESLASAMVRMRQSETIKMQMDPVPEIDLSLHEEDCKRFVVVEIKAGSETPYYTFVKGHRDAFIRIGNGSVKANAIQLKRLVLKSTGQTWDVLDSPFLRTNYAFDALRATYFKKTEMPFEESDFKLFGLVGSDGFLTNAGALFADDSPIRHSRLFCTRWRGLAKADVMDESSVRAVGDVDWDVDKIRTWLGFWTWLRAILMSRSKKLRPG